LKSSRILSVRNGHFPKAIMSVGSLRKECRVDVATVAAIHPPEVLPRAGATCAASDAASAAETSLGRERCSAVQRLSGADEKRLNWDKQEAMGISAGSFRISAAAWDFES
jgi:hypothetical protein